MLVFVLCSRQLFVCCFVSDTNVVQACRVPALEGLLKASKTPKKIILVLNKIDLVPPEVVRQVRVLQPGL